MSKALSVLLRNLRKAKGSSLREIEKVTKISNAYLSQMERGDAQNPSPDKLHALAEFYSVPYMDLMRAAGYVEKSSVDGPARNLSASELALKSADLTPEETEAVIKYVQFLRYQKKE